MISTSKAVTFFFLFFFYFFIFTEEQQEDQCFSTILNPLEFSQLPPTTYQDIVTCSFGYSKVKYNETIICDSYNNIFIEKEGKYCLDTNDCIISSFGTFFSCVNNKCTFSKTRVLGDDCLENENCLEGICWNGKCNNYAGFNNENNKPVLKLGQDCPQNQMDGSNLICERSLDCITGKCVSVKKVEPFGNCDASYNDLEFIPPTADLLTRNYSLNLCYINYSCASGNCIPFYYFNENEICDFTQVGFSYEVCKFGRLCKENYFDFRKRCFPYDYSFFKSIGSSCDSTDECQIFIPNVECFKGKCVANSLKEGEYCESNYHCASELCVENRCIKLLDNDTFCDINNGCKNPNNVCTCGGKLMESGKGRCLDINCNKFKYELASCLSYFPALQNIMMLLQYNQIIVDPKSSIFKKYCNLEFIRYYACLKQSQNNANLQTTDIPGFLQLDDIDLQNYKLNKKDNNYNLNVTEPLLSNITYFQIPEMNTTTHTIVNSLNRLLVMTINPKITNVTVSNNDFVGCTCCNEDVLRIFQNAQEYYNKTITVKFKSGVRLQKYEPVMGHSSFIYRNWQKCEYIVAPPSEVDGLALAIKNNLLLLNDGWTVEQINNLKMSDIFTEVEFYHISYNYQIIPKFIRQYENLSKQVLNNITIEVKKDLDYVENIYKKLNTTKLSLKEIKKYHDKITNYNFELKSFLELSYLQFYYDTLKKNVTDLIQYDNWFLKNAFIKNNYTNNYKFIKEILSSPNKVDHIFVPIETFGGYNSYLGVFHYSDVNQFGLLILKDALLYFIIVLGTLFYIGIILLYKKSLSLKRRLFIPFIGPLCIILLCIPYLEPILLRFHKQLKMKAHIYHLIPIPNGLMSILIGTYMVMVLRFIYLRNLYTIVEKFKYIKFHKILSSKIAAFLLLMISAILIFGAWFGIYFGIMSAILTKSDGSFEWSLQFDATIISLTTQIAFLSFISITCLIIDAIISRKTIKLKGLRYYLFFDDPFFLRIDLFIMVVMIIVAIIILLDILIWETLIINRIFLAIFFILCYMVLGGTIIFSEIINFIFKKEKETNESKMQLENYMEDYNFRELFKQYCINEYSLENYLFYEFLENLEKKKEITNQDINYLQETFLDRHAQYEVNFPGVTIRKYKALIESINIENELIPFEKFDEIFKQEILRNLIDTLGRLEQTKEYKKWFATKSIQIENEL